MAKLSVLQQQHLQAATTHTNGTSPPTVVTVTGAVTNGVVAVLSGGAFQPVPRQGEAGAVVNAEADVIEARAAEDYGLASPSSTAEQLPLLLTELSEDQKAYARKV